MTYIYGRCIRRQTKVMMVLEQAGWMIFYCILWDFSLQVFLWHITYWSNAIWVYVYFVLKSIKGRKKEGYYFINWCKALATQQYIPLSYLIGDLVQTRRTHNRIMCFSFDWTVIPVPCSASVTRWVIHPRLHHWYHRYWSTVIEVAWSWRRYT